MGTDHHRRLLVAAVFAAVASTLLLFVYWDWQPQYSVKGATDNYSYFELAGGRPDNVSKPFSGRFLLPLLVHITADLTGLTTLEAFFTWGLISLVLLVFSVSLLVISVRPGTNLLFFATIILSPPLFKLFKEYMTPDVLHSALAGLFFLLLLFTWDKRPPLKYLAFLLLFPLYITRESTLLLSLSIIVVSFLGSDRPSALAATAVTALGAFAVFIAGQMGQANPHGLNDWLWLLGKMPYNFLRNVLGVVPWTDTLAAQQPDLCKPIWTMDVPSWVPSGSIQRIGLCGFDFILPLRTLSLFLTLFGILPTVAIFLARREGKELCKKTPMWLPVVMLYGVLSFLAGPLLGSGVDRLMAYGWPAFWIGVPVLLLPNAESDLKWLVPVSVCQALVSWIPVLLGAFVETPVLWLSLSLILAAVGHLIALQTLQRGYYSSVPVG